MPQPLDLSRQILAITDGQNRPAGHSVPPTTGSQAQGVSSTGDGTVQRQWPQAPGDVADQDDRGPAMRRSANWYGWRPQHGLEVQGYRETYADLGDISAGGTASLNVNLATNFVANALGNCTLDIVAPDAPVDLDPYAPTPQFLVGIKLWITRPVGALITFPSGVQWSVDVTDPAGDGSVPSLLAKTKKVGTDNLVFVVIPGKLTMGYIASRAG